MSRKLKSKLQPASGRQRVPRRQHERRILLFIWILIPLAIALSLGLVGYWYYNSYVAVWHQAVVKVNGTPIDMDYFVKLLRLTSRSTGTTADPASFAGQVLTQIEDDELIRQGALRLEIKVTPEEVTEQIKDFFSPTSTPTEGEETLTPTPQQDFDKTYQQWPAQIQLSDKEYRQLVETSLLSQKVIDYLEEQKVPKEGEQVHLHVIQVDSEEKALEIADRIKGGQDFAALAKELSQDTQSNEQGGDLGWVPRGIYPDLDEVAFGLEPGVLSEPIQTSLGYYLIKVSEKVESRPIDEQYRQALATDEFQKWLADERAAAKIEKYLTDSKIVWAASKIKQQE